MKFPETSTTKKRSWIRLKVKGWFDPDEVVSAVEGVPGVSRVKDHDDVADPTPTCPLCGREFDHKYEASSGVDPLFASDVGVCERRQVSGARTYYVHYP